MVSCHGRVGQQQVFTAQAAFRGGELSTDHPSGEQHTGEMAVGLYAAPRKSRFGKSREQLKHGPFQEPAIADC